MQADSIALVRRWAGDSERWVNAFLKGVPSIGSIVSVVVLGSAVRECGHRRSDLDLLVIYRGKRPVINAPLEVDIRYVSIEGIDGRIEKGHEILCWALKFGTALYDPERYWEYLQQSWGTRIPLPCATDARERGQQALTRATELLEIGDESAADDLILAALTQFARERLIKAGIFPASRPELPAQLRTMEERDPLATILEDAMHGDSTASELINRFKINAPKYGA